MCVESLLHLAPVDHHRIEGGGGVLVDHGDGGAAQAAQAGLVQADDVLAVDQDAAAGHTAVLRQVTHDAEGDGRLAAARFTDQAVGRSEEHTSELQSLMRNSYAVFCLKKKNNKKRRSQATNQQKNKLAKQNINKYTTLIS